VLATKLQYGMYGAISLGGSKSTQQQRDDAQGPAVRETGGKPVDQPDRPIRRPEQQGTRIRRYLALVKRGHHRPPLNGCKSRPTRAASGVP